MKTNKYEEALVTISLLLKKLHIYDYFFDDKITEIDINPDNTIFIQKLGEGSIMSKELANPDDTKNLIQILASLELQVINADNPRISTILPIGNARFEGLVPPVVANPSCAIRKKIVNILTLDDYIKQEAITIEHKKLIESYVMDKKNILIVGATNTGKTTFANAILKVIEDERLVFIEDIRELQCQNKNNVFIQVIPGIFSPKDALKSTLRFSPERVIYGEVRGAEAFDLINAFNSGHKGGICTIHANDAYLGLQKLETYIMYEKEQPLSGLIARTFDVVITMKLENNKRVLDSIAEIIDYQDDKYILDFKYLRTPIVSGDRVVSKKKESTEELLLRLIEQNISLQEKILSFQEKIFELERRIS